MSSTTPPGRATTTMVAVAAFFVAGGAAAQMGDVTPDALTFVDADCGSAEMHEIQFEVPLEGQFFWSLRLMEQQPNTGQACPRFGDAPAVHVVIPFGEAELAAGGEFNLLQSFTAAELLGPLCEDAPDRDTFPLCIYFSATTAMPTSNLDIDATSPALPIAVDTAIPARPDITGIAEGENKLTLNVAGLDDMLGDTYEFDVHYRPCTGEGDDAGGGADGGVAGVDGGVEDTIDEAESVCDAPGPYRVRKDLDAPVIVDGLANEVLYEVRVVAIDDFGNRSEPSASETGTPRNELTPLDFYNGSPNPLSVAGPDCEACTQGTTTMSFLGLGLLALGRLRRRRPRGYGARRAGVAGLLGVGLLHIGAVAVPLVGGTSAQAYVGQLTVGLKGGPYTPNIDSERVNGTLIYPIFECFFEKGTFTPNGVLPMPAVDVDVHLFDKFGSLELGVGLAVTQVWGKAAPASAGGAALISTRTCPSEYGNENVELTILMAKPQLTYRLDPLHDYFGIPFVPYARIGLVTAAYGFTQNGAFDNGNIASGQNPLGVRFGAEATVGMMFALDWLDLRYLWDLVAKKKIVLRGRYSSALEHAYVFGEVSTSQIDTFGLPGLILSPTDRVFGTGLPWTFQIGMAMEIL